MAGAALMAVWTFPYFGLLNSGVSWVVFIGMILGLIPHSIQYGPQSSLIAESFPTQLRYGGAGIGYQLASVVAGGPAPLIATYLIHQFGSPYALSVYIVGCSVVTLVACGLLPDRSAADIADDAVYETSGVGSADAQPAT